MSSKPGRKRAKGDFRGIKLSNKTHRSSTDPDALLCRKSKANPTLPSYRGHVLMDNRHALIVDCKVTQATGAHKIPAVAEKLGHLAAYEATLGISLFTTDDSMGVPTVQFAHFIGALLGALFGRKALSTGTVGRATTSMRGIGRAAREKEDIATFLRSLEGDRRPVARPRIPPVGRSPRCQRRRSWRRGIASGGTFPRPSIS